MDLSIVIVNWNAKEYLKKCIESIYAFPGDIDFEVFVVDNNSSDASPEMVKTEFPSVRLIANKENLGFAKANNRAIAQSKGRYILVLNPDTQITEHAIDTMFAYMEAHRHIGILAPQLVFPDGRKQASILPAFTFFSYCMNKYFPRSRYAFTMHHAATRKKVYNPTGACLFVRREVFEKIGLFDELFFVCFEDIDFCHRSNKAGIGIIFFPDTRIIHHKSVSSKYDYWQCARYKAQGLGIFVRKHYGLPGIYFLLFDSFIQLCITHIIFPFTRIVVGRPNDVEFLKKEATIQWQSIVKSK